MKTEKISVRITEQQKKLLEEEAAKRDIPTAQLLRELIKAYFEKEGK